MESGSPLSPISALASIFFNLFGLSLNNAVSSSELPGSSKVSFGALLSVVEFFSSFALFLFTVDLDYVIGGRNPPIGELYVSDSVAGSGLFVLNCADGI